MRVLVRSLALIALLSLPLVAQEVINGGGGGSGSSAPVGNSFYASTTCSGLTNCVALVDDDSTNNCGTALTNWIAAINAYSGNGQPYVTFQMSGGGKAFLFSTCSMTFTNPVVIQANATFDAGTNTSSNLINFGLAATCTTTANCAAFRWNGGTFLGGASLTNGIFEMKANINDFRLSGMMFLNVGTGNATLGSCTNYAILIDNPVANGKVQDTKYTRTDATTGWCAYSNPNGAAGGTNTIEFMNNAIGSGTGCGSVAIWDGGSLGNIVGGTIFGAAIPIRLVGIGHRLSNLELDANSCIAHAVQAPIQWGGPSASTIRGISITDVTYQSETGNTGFFQKAGDDAGSTIGGISLIGNKQVGRSGGSQALLGPSSSSCSTASLLNSTDFCYAGGNWGVQMPTSCVATSTNVNWMFNNQLADCLFNVTSAANETAQILFTSNSSNANQNYLTYVNCQVLLYQAATTSSTLPQCQVTWTDNKTSVVQTSTVTPVWASGTVGCSGTTTNTVGNLCTGTIGPINPKVGTSVSIQTINYASVGGTSMFYQLIGTAYVAY